ncbi:MAG: DUF3726 domain-containing protein [Paracoccaceae bacterium]
MSWAFGEIEALVRKAVQGAGKPWGIAEEAAWCVRWLSERGHPGVEAVASSLDVMPERCPVNAALMFSERGSLTLPSEIGPVASPLMVLPFLGRMCAEGAAFKVQTETAEVRVSRNDIEVRCNLPEVGTVMLCEITPAIAPGERRARLEHVDPVALEILHDFAARTYAPATELSRKAGAGAGLSDND